ncbi:hypothetical protein LSAT2_031467 [Lamellibrachia satsuma]|nr:hypothetical protein LSAT2_031467 [Lamellibrachia satsuma]
MEDGVYHKNHDALNHLPTSNRSLTSMRSFKLAANHSFTDESDQHVECVSPLLETVTEHQQRTRISVPSQHVDGSHVFLVSKVQASSGPGRQCDNTIRHHTSS